MLFKDFFFGVLITLLAILGKDVWLFLFGLLEYFLSLEGVRLFLYCMGGGSVYSSTAWEGDRLQ